MKKYRVCGTTTVTVYKEVWANNEDEAIDKADKDLYSLTAFLGNGGTDKLIGVYDSDESVSADNYIEWNDTEELEDNPDYFECPDCDEECEVCEHDDGNIYYHCENCDKYYDKNGDEFYPDVDCEEDE